MDADNIFSMIKELGHTNSKRSELQEYCSNKFDQIIKLLPRRILNSDGADILDCILNGVIEDQIVGFKNKVKIIDIVLEIMRKECTSLTHCSDVISRVCLELQRMPASDLVRWCNDSVQSIVDHSDVNMIWRDILPECTSALSSHSTVKHCNIEMPGEEYKEQCIHTLCQCRWSEQQLVQLAAMFKDMQLSKASHLQVVNKICSYIIDLKPETVPPLVHQLIKLCKTSNLEVVVGHVSQYFSAHLYSRLEPPPHDSESTTMDIDDTIPLNEVELNRCLSTCLYHAWSCAGGLRRLARTWPRTQLLRAPFVLHLVLALADKGPEYRAVCLDAIRSSIEQRLTDEVRRVECAWVRAVIPPDVDLPSLFKILTTESANHRQLTTTGLISLAFSLLSVSRVKPCARRCWSLGKLVLVRICKSQPETTPHVLSQLGDRLATNVAHKQYADCLYALCKLHPSSMERCSQLTTILESCQPVGGEYRSAAAVLDAVHPLLNYSTRTRDVLVMVCRKGLYSRDSAQRCLSLSGLVSVLRHVRVSRTSPGDADTQEAWSDQYSAHSYLTQLTLDVHATQHGNGAASSVRNEAMCMEVVSIVRRCLAHDAAVKQLLYTNIFECTKEKAILYESILELLYEHLTKYLPEGADNAVLWDKCVQINGATAVLIEPLPRLLYAIAQVVQPNDSIDIEDILSSQSETNTGHLTSKLCSILNNMCKNRHLTDIDMEDPPLTDITPESKAKCMKVQLMLQCYEALIAHQIMQCTANSTEFGDIVGSLFKHCHQLTEQTKTPPKSKKAKLNETRETVKSQKSQRDKGKSVKLSNLAKDRAGPFRPLPCLWDLPLCCRLVELLYGEEVSWCGVEQRNSIRSRRELHQWALRGIGAVVENTDKRTVGHLVNITAVLYHRCLCRLDSLCEFDEQTALATLELFKTCLSVLLSESLSLKHDKFINKITGLSDPTPSTNIAAILDHVHTALLALDGDRDADDRDAASKKMLSALFGIAALLLEVPLHCCASMCTMVVKFEEYVRVSRQECLPLVMGTLAAAARDHQDSQLIDDLLKKLTQVLGTIDEQDSVPMETASFPWIEERSGQLVLGAVCTYITQRLKYAEHVVVRARDLNTARNTAVRGHLDRIQKELCECYKSTIVELCQCCVWCAGAARVRCGVRGGAAGGGCSDKVLGLAVRLYAVLAALARHIPTDVATSVRFERLLKLSSKKLSSVIDDLITYLEASQTEQNATKVLRDTKLIPRLVLEAENYSKNVILLSNKLKVNWQQYMSLGTARDFRIKGLEEVLHAREQHDIQEDTRDEDEIENINDAQTEILSGHDGGTQSKRRRVS